MSFSNDDDGDGLAALFGGITPQAGSATGTGRRRAAPAASPQPDPPEPARFMPPAASAYPGLAAELPPAPSRHSMPAPASGSSGFAMPAPEPQASQSYDLPAPTGAAPSGLPGYPIPAAPGQAEAPRHPDLAPPPPYPSGPAPGAPGYPGAAPQPGSAQYPSAQYPSAGHPATAGRSTTPQSPGPGPVPAFPVVAADPALAARPGYPATAPYPANANPTSYAPPEALARPVPSYPSGYDRPAHEVPAAQPGVPSPGVPSPSEPPAHGIPGETVRPAPVVEPPPLTAAPGFGGFETLGLQPAAGHPVGSPAGPVESVREPRLPTADSYARPPLVPAGAVPAGAASLVNAFPPGPLLPSSVAAVDSPEDLERSTPIEKAGLVLALLTGPIGLGLAIATAIRGARRRGWVIRIARASLVLGVVSTVVAGIAGYLLWNIRADQIQHDEIAASSAEFCAAGDADPALVTAPTLGWPSPGATTAESLALMQAWTDRWRSLAEVSPPELRTGMGLLADTGQEIVDAVAVSRSIDDAANLAQISAVEPQSGVASWYLSYCVQP